MTRKYEYALGHGKYQEAHRRACASYHQRLRAAVLMLLGGKCANPNCRHLNLDGTLGCTDSRLLHIDHIHKDGYKERKVTRSATALLRKILRMNNPAEVYRLLCASCNWLYRYEDL